jgi:hypothetical protein
MEVIKVTDSSLHNYVAHLSHRNCSNGLRRCDKKRKDPITFRYSRFDQITKARSNTPVIEPKPGQEKFAQRPVQIGADPFKCKISFVT